MSNGKKDDSGIRLREDNTPSFKPFVFHHISGLLVSFWQKLFLIVKYHSWVLHKHSLKVEKHCIFAVDFTCVHSISKALHNARDGTISLDPSKIMIRRPDTITSRPWMDNGRCRPASTGSDCPKGRRQHVSQMRENWQANFFCENVNLTCTEVCPSMGDEKYAIPNY